MFSGIPSWLQTSKINIQRSEEWLTFSKDLFDALSGPMREHGVRTFGALSPAEQKLLIVEAVESLRSMPSYGELLRVVSRTVDQEVGVAADTAIRETNQQLSKLEFIENQCHEAVDVILKKWPETKVHIQQCFGTILSNKLRRSVWNAQLENVPVKDEYKRLVASGQKQKLVSLLDFEISQKCQSLLKTDSTVASLLSMKAAPSIMRHLLSFHHARSKSKTSLTDTEYLLSIPFVYCILSTVVSDGDKLQKQNITTDVLASLIGQYELFLCDRPDYMTAPAPVHSFSGFSSEVAAILNGKVRGLVDRLDKLLSKVTKISEHGESLSRLLHPIMRSFMVGYLPLETVMFVWDQHIISYGAENFDPLFSICASLMLLLQKELLDCSSWREVEAAVVDNLRTVTSEQLRGAMVDHGFIANLRYSLEHSTKNKRQYPVSHTSVLQSLPPWRHWYSVKLAGHFQKARKKGSELPRAVYAESVELSAGEDLKRDNEVLVRERDMLVDELQLMRDEVDNMRKLLVDEQIAKSDIQERADDEIERLRCRVEHLERQPEAEAMPFRTGKLGLTTPQYAGSDTSRIATPTPTEQSDAKRAPTPTEQSDAKRASREEAPQSLPDDETVPKDVDAAFETDGEESEAGVDESKIDEEEALQTMQDLVSQMMGGIRLIVHGTDEEKTQLDAQTESDMRQIRKAYELAKLDVLGRTVSDEEMASLPEKDRQKFNSKLSEATRKRLLKLKFM